jgi:hypothetical protein
MSYEEIVVLSLIVVAFMIFGVTLGWVSHR